jgi:transmembrane sensor
MTIQRLPPVVVQATQWLALQRSGAMSEADRQGLEQWLQAAPENREAWLRLEQCLGQAFANVPGLSREVLSSAGSHRRNLLRGALCLASVGTTVWLLQREGVWPLGASDLQTDVAQRRAFNLADGSRVLLNARSRVDMAFDARQRVLILHEGALSIDVAADTARPLVVRTVMGEVRALGTRFSVALTERAAQVWVQESRVQVSNHDGSSVELHAGQGAELDRRTIRLLDPRQARAAVWDEGVLEVNDRPLRDVIESLRPYRRGWLHISEPAAALRVSGVFPLDDSNQALRSLEEHLPIRIEQRFGWWTQISLN